jgi:hypothetical protein
MMARERERDGVIKLLTLIGCKELFSTPTMGKGKDINYLLLLIELVLDGIDTIQEFAEVVVPREFVKRDCNLHEWR